MSDAVLSVRDLHVAFGRKGVTARAVDGVDLELRRGEVLALVGESGCGKTTVLRSLMGLARPTGGEVLFDGAPVADLKAFRRQVQMVFQDPTGALNPRRTIYEAVAEGLRIHRVAGDEHAQVCGALARAGLRPPERFLLRYPHELSGGQRQRVVIAGALALEPSVLLADEPVSNLDVSVRGAFLQLLLDLRETLGISVLIVTHDLGLAWTIADRVAVMYLGRVVEVGPTEQVLSSPCHPYARALLAVAKEPDGGSGLLLQGEPPDPTRIPGGCRFHPRCPIAEERCRSLDVALRDVGPDHATACHLAAPTEDPA